MVVLDSSFVIAFHNNRDAHHTAAGTVMEQLLAGEWGDALLPEYVFLEVVTVLAARRDLAVAVSVGDILLEAREIEFVPCSDIFPEAVRIFRGQRRRGPSFADAAILAIAREREAGYIATFDTGFRELAGVSVVPA